MASASTSTPVTVSSSKSSGSIPAAPQKRKRAPEGEEVNRDIGLPTPTKQKFSHVKRMKRDVLKSQLQYYKKIFFSAAIEMNMLLTSAKKGQYTTMKKFADDMEEAKRKMDITIALLGDDDDTHIPIEGCRICGSYFDNSECTCPRDE